jgi:hypothetical protein
MFGSAYLLSFHGYPDTLMMVSGFLGIVGCRDGIVHRVCNGLASRSQT